MSWLNRQTEQEDLRGELEPEEFDSGVTDYLSGIFAILEKIETHLQEIVNQNDKLVENSTRLTMLFERLEKGANNADLSHRGKRQRR